MKQITFRPDFESWRAVARQLIAERVSPGEVRLLDCDQDSALWTAEFANGRSPLVTNTIMVPRHFIDLGRYVARHLNPQRWQLLYSALWRLQQDRDLFKLESDNEIGTLRLMEQQVRRDVNRMQESMRFQRIERERKEYLVAWHRPDYPIVELAAPFFAERFSAMRWSILTPYRSAYWEPAAKKLQFGKGVPRFTPPQTDELEELWLRASRSVFDPVHASAKATPIPPVVVQGISEAEFAPPLFKKAPERVQQPIAQTQYSSSAALFLPNNTELPVLKEAVQRCQGCELHRCATQAVFGLGPVSARIVLVGEQPGNDEDLAGKPFVGPAGKLLDRALAEAGIERESVYITNAVKHFKFERRGIKRIHRTPEMKEITACRPWLEAELKAVKPEIIVCMGATAMKSLLNLQNMLMKHRGQIFRSPYAEKVIVTVHPSAILRVKDPMASEQLFQTLCRDLRLARDETAKIERPAQHQQAS